MSDGEVLLRAILEFPDDDGARLVYADWLEEQGQEARAEFVRVQVALASLGECQRDFSLGLSCCCPFCDAGGFVLRRRERELLKGNGASWAGPAVVAACGGAGINWEWRRGFVHTVRCKFHEWYGGPCNHHDLFERSLEDDPYGSFDVDPGDCIACHGKGTVPGFGAAIVASHPIEVVEVSDREPFEWVPGRFWWLNEHVGDVDLRPSRLPYPLWRAVNPANDEYKPTEWSTAADATAALSAVLLAHARSTF